MTRNVLIFVKTVDHLQSIYRYCFEKTVGSQDKNGLSPNPTVGITFHRYRLILFKIYGPLSINWFSVEFIW